MCGINGVYVYGNTAPPVDDEELIRVRDYMAARGPDGYGKWVSDDGRVGLGHRRLSIIDITEAGAQPMRSADGRFIITFNGEIYNFRSIRLRLEEKGYVFRTQSDTEVLLHLYADKGQEMVSDLRGMFALAIWDCAKKGVFLARDPYGIKPLYYADCAGTVRFASQVKALLASGKISTAPDPAGWIGFYLFGHVPEPHTTYFGIRSVPAGATVWIDKSGAHEPRRYFSIAKIYRDSENAPAISDAIVQNEVRSALLDSVRHHLVADVPVGAFLSAGIDSGALVGLMRDCGQQEIQTVTLRYSEFQGKEEDEVPLAAEVARLYGAGHTIRTVTEAEFVADLPLILRAMDQPTVDGINTWFVSKAARELGLKVAISGLGGDELLGGYSTFRDLPRMVKSLAILSSIPGAPGAFRAVMNGITQFVPSVSRKLHGLIDYGGTFEGAYLLRRGLFLPSELHAVLQDDAFIADGLRRLDPLQYIKAALTPRPQTEHARVATLESSLYMRNQLLRDSDWASMAHSLEVRVPLVDATLLRLMAPIMTRSRTADGKRLLSQSPTRPLPETIVARKKTGFGIPVQTWIQRSARSNLYGRVPALADKNCPWARRWAYEVSAA